MSELKGKFVHLHLHTEFSLLDGFARIDRLFDRVKELNMDAVAITDHGSMFGVVDFYKAAKAKGVKPIIGCEVYVAARSMTDKDSVLDKRSAHLVLLAKNETGYRNLIKMVSDAYIDGYYYKPRIDFELLEQHSEGLIALSACLAGNVNRALLYDQYNEAVEIANNISRIMGPDNFYLELQEHFMEENKKVNPMIVKLSEETGLPLVASNDVHYTVREDAKTHDVLMCIQMGKTIHDEERLEFPNDEFYIKSYEEMAKMFPYAPEALANTVKIAERCNLEFDFDTYHLPEYDLPAEVDHQAYLRELCIEGMKKRYDDYEQHLDRLNFELETINTMGYDDYFLITWDFIKYSKENGIVVGPGRGSCGGSIVAYVLEITDVDPIRYDLIFERFLNPERVSMPDIDIDFEDDRRQEVIDYVIDKYGKDHVAQIITFGTMAARAAIRDVARAVDMSYADADRLAKEIPFQLGMTITKALEMNPKLKQMYGGDAEVKRVLDVAKSLEGVPRHASTHAAGVVISKKAVDQYVPLYVNDGNISTQFNMVLLEELGLLKLDFLGLKTLTVIKNAKKILEKSKGLHIDFNEIPMDDEATYKLISSGDTLGVFQLESSGMRRFMRELKPVDIEDIIAGISLYRPGPMDSIPKYIANKNKTDAIEYDHPMLKDIMEVTYGCLVYQEQVMSIVRELGGYSYSRSDLVRRAMSKKKMKVMEQERINFIHGIVDENGEIEVEGCLRRGVPESVANTIFDDMIAFANYAFNKSHAAGYAIIAYQTAYLKAHYPVEFMAALMTSVMGNHSKVAQYIQDCRNMDIEVLPPSVNESQASFSVVNGKIRYGLLNIKNVGKGIIKSMTTCVEDGPFTSFMDFLERIDQKELNKRAVESLIKAGAFDDLQVFRSQLLAVFEKTIDGIQNDRRKNVAGQLSLFDGGGEIEESFSKIKFPEINEFNQNVLLAFEKEMIGVYLTGHPLTEHKELVDRVSTMNLSDLFDGIKNDDGSFEIKDNSHMIIGGLVVTKTMKATKNNNMMAFITLEDLFSTIEVIVFPKIYDRCAEFLKEEGIIAVSGRLNIKEDEDPKLIADNIMLLTEENVGQIIGKRYNNNNRIFKNNFNRQVGGGQQMNQGHGKVVQGQPRTTQGINKVCIEGLSKLYLKFSDDDLSKYDYVKAVLKRYRGKIPVVIYLESSKKKMVASQDLWVNIDKNLIYELENLIGDDSVKLIEK